MEVAPFFVDFHHFLSIFTIYALLSRFTHFFRKFVLAKIAFSATSHVFCMYVLKYKSTSYKKKGLGYEGIRFWYLEKKIHHLDVSHPRTLLLDARVCPHQLWLWSEDNVRNFEISLIPKIKNLTSSWVPLGPKQRFTVAASFSERDSQV